MVAWLLLNAGAVVVAAALACAGGGRRPGSRLVLAALGGYLVVIHTLVLAAGLLGQLTPLGLGVPLAAAVVAATWIARGSTRDPERPDAVLAARPVDGEGFAAAARFASLAAVAAGLGWVWPHVVRATRLWVWDDYVYHMVYPALWLREQVIASPSPAQQFTMQAWYPLSASVVAAWFMAPFDGSRGEALAWVSLTGPLYAGLVAAAVVELFRRLGCRSGAWAVPVVLLATSPRVGVMASSFSDADLAHASALFAAFVFAMPDRRSERGRDLDGDAWYAALLSGFALGVKVSAAIPALIALAVLASRAWALSPPRRSRWTALARVGCVFVAAWVATAGYWYARNTVATGNPVYPAAFLGRPGTTFPETTLREYAAHYGLRRTVADALVVYVDWPRAYAALAVLALVGLAGWLVWRGRSAPRSRRHFAVGVLVTTAAVLLFLPLMPYSAGNAMTFRSGLVHWDSMRYIALVPILGWAALGFLIDVLGRWGALVAAVLAAAALLASRAPVVASPVVLLALAVGAVVGEPYWRRARAWRWRAVVPWAAATLLVAAALARHGPKTAATAASIYTEPLFGAAAAVLDRQPLGMRVAVFGDQWVYPAFGARDHLVPVRLDRDGRVAARPIGDAMEPGDLTVDAATFRANLAAARIGIVVVVHLPHPGRSPEWPTQQAALASIPDAHLLHRDAGAAVWRLGAIEMGAPTWPPSPQPSDRPGGAVTVLE